MKKSTQKLILSEIAAQLTHVMESRKLTVGQIARDVGEQHHTVQRIADGKNFMIMHTWWLADLGINVPAICKHYINIEGKGESRGNKKKGNSKNTNQKTNNQERKESISASSFF